MFKKRTYLLLTFACLALSLQAQISPLADQFLINPFLTNPALAGTSKKAPLSLTARQQMLGLTGAPAWQSVTWHKSLGAKKKHFNPRGFINKGDNAFGNIGVGAGAFSVKYGAISQVGVHLDYAYHVYVNKGRLSFGIAPMYHQYIIDKSGFIAPDGSTPDPLLDRAGKEVLHFFDVNAGVHYFTSKLFAGFSVVQLFNSSVSFGDLSYESLGENFDNPYLARSAYLYGGLTPALGENVTLEPSIVVNYNGQNGLGIQANLRATFYDNLQLGLLYHFRESTGFFVGIRLGDVLFRYQFEAPLGTAVLTRYVTHQIMVGYLFL